MDIEKVKQLAKLMEEFALTDLELSEGEFSVRLGRSEASGKRQSLPGDESPLESAAKSGGKVTSPMVGVFYAASAQGEEPFVKLGQRVRKGEVLCIIEAMKLMNEIVAERDGIITDICVDNGSVVEFGQTLFIVGEVNE